METSEYRSPRDHTGSPTTAHDRTRNRIPLLALLAANVTSIFGSAMTLLAIPWFVLDTTNSAVQTGAVTATETVGLGISAVLSSPLVDRLGARRASIYSDLAAAGAVTAVPVIHVTSGLALWQIVVLTALLGITQSPGLTARSVLLRDLIRTTGSRMERVNSANESMARLGRLLGGPLAGVLIAATDPPGVLFLDGVTFAISAILVALAIPASTGRDGHGNAGDGGYAVALRQGLSYLRRDRLITAVVGMVMLTNLLDAATIGVLFPIYARNVLHSSVALGLMDGVFAAGTVSGTLMFGWVGHRLPRRTTYVAILLIGGAPRFLSLVTQPPLIVILLVMGAAGFALGAVNPLLYTVMYERVPNHLLSRVLGIMSAGMLAGAPAGALLAGILTAPLGIMGTLAVFGIVYLVAALLPLIFRRWRELDHLSVARPGSDEFRA